MSFKSDPENSFEYGKVSQAKRDDEKTMGLLNATELMQDREYVGNLWGGNQHIPHI